MKGDKIFLEWTPNLKKKLPLWIRFLLWFKQPYYTQDFAHSRNCMIMSKKLFGKIYVLKEWYD